MLVTLSSTGLKWDKKTRVAKLNGLASQVFIAVNSTGLALGDDLDGVKSKL